MKKPLLWRLHNLSELPVPSTWPRGAQGHGKIGLWGQVPGGRLIQASLSAREASIRRDPEVVCPLTWPLSCHLQRFPCFTVLSPSSSSLEASSASFRSVFSDKTKSFWFSVSSSVNGNNLVLHTSRLKHLWKLKLETQHKWKSAYHCYLCEWKLFHLKAVRHCTNIAVFLPRYEPIRY